MYKQIIRPFPIGDGDEINTTHRGKKKKRKEKRKQFIRLVLIWPTHNSSISFSLLFATSLLELHLAHVHDAGRYFVDVLFLSTETEDVESTLCFLVLLLLQKWFERLIFIKYWIHPL